MLINFLSHLLAFDFAWIIALVMNNLLLVFGVIGMALFWTDGTNYIF